MYDIVMLRIRSLLMPVLLLPMVHADDAENAVPDNGPAEAMVSGFLLPPVHWDKNISVVDLCGSPLPGADNVVQWPDTTGELLKLMDALKYEYETRCFQCVVFSLDASAEGEAAQKALNALVECVTVCDMLRIPLRLAVRKGEDWLDIAPTYTTQTASNLMLGEDGRIRMFNAASELQLTVATVAEAESALKTAAEQEAVVNLFWQPQAATFASFIELVELCNALSVEYALMLRP